ncbi:MAG: hypothetical protein ACTHJ4_07845, partial [Candidatus Nucleicultricaceae bacterium]
EPLRGSFDYLSHLFQNDTYTLEWEIPALSLNSIQVIGSDGEITLPKKEVHTSNFRVMINNKTIVPETSTILEYWRFRSMSPETQSRNRIDVLAPKTIALGIKRLEGDHVGLVKGIIITTDLEEADDSYKPKGFMRRPDGKLDIVDSTQQKPYIHVTRITKKTTPTKEAWLSTLNPNDVKLSKPAIPSKPAHAELSRDE